ncbi:hypothetical protein [Lysinibacillus parviboronicapiens]|uniref:hypothetical protein n=1 Tax=Lysinibacillus parviboronicapiens TaxID=436516 RepID=UPI001EE76D27|nr:hypothetical protein [Lysinibacillus parviboronicapiens]
MATNSYKQIYRGSKTLLICEYCNAVKEDVPVREDTMREVTVRVENEVQNDAQNEKSAGKVLTIIALFLFTGLILELIFKL